MAVTLNHTIVAAHDKRESAQFLSEMLGLPDPIPFGPFLVSEGEFDEVFGRIVERGLPYWADPFRQRPGEVNTHDGGRGVCWNDPGGHVLEIITRPYGSGAGG